jgi:predicted metal-dependent phosphotriesterase family hydrolase
MEHLVRDILPALRARGIPPRDLETMLVANPRRLLTPALV